MSGLSELSLHDTGISPERLTPEVMAAFHVERCRRGWPRIMLDCILTYDGEDLGGEGEVDGGGGGGGEEGEEGQEDDLEVNLEEEA
jgi:hypothetical protein